MSLLLPDFGGIPLYLGLYGVYTKFCKSSSASNSSYCKCLNIISSVNLVTLGLSLPIGFNGYYKTCLSSSIFSYRASVK